jgi:hypothetical protein
VRILVVVTVDLDVREIAQLRDLSDERVRVVAPLAQLSHAQWLANDDGAERAAAEERVRRVAAAVAPAAERKVGDDDVILTIEDQLREFDADEIWLIMTSESEASWLETGVYCATLERFGLPIVRVVAHGPADR